MPAITNLHKFNTIDIKGEKFVLLKEDYINELFTLFKSYQNGEKLLKEKKTRNFDTFLKSSRARK